MLRQNAWDYVEYALHAPLAVAIWGIIFLVAIADFITGGGFPSSQTVRQETVCHSSSGNGSHKKRTGISFG